MSGEDRAPARPGEARRERGADWRALVAGLVEAVRFDQRPADAVARLTELIVVGDALRGGPREHLAAIQSALGSHERIAELLPQQHTEGGLRAMLAALERSLGEWIHNGPSVTQLEARQWRPGASPVVAQVAWEPVFLARWLGVSFEETPDPLGAVRIAVLRLASGRVVALAQVVGNPAPGTSLLQLGASAPSEVVEDFLADTRLSRDVVEWTAAGTDPASEPG